MTQARAMPVPKLEGNPATLAAVPPPVALRALVAQIPRQALRAAEQRPLLAEGRCWRQFVDRRIVLFCWCIQHWWIINCCWSNFCGRLYGNRRNFD